MKIICDRQSELEIRSELIGYRWPVFSLIEFTLLPARAFNINFVKRSI